MTHANATSPGTPGTPGPDSSESPEFSHRLNFTTYQQVVLGLFADIPTGSVLDIPAGGGQMAGALRERGFDVTAADINQHDDSFVYADMTARFPFADEQFDTVVCLEGVEHVLDPHGLMGELFRVCRVGGRVIISTPNVNSLYSRIQHLFTGTHHMFHFSQLRDLPPGAQDDRFHVSPVCLGRLWYEATYWGGRPERVTGDRIKRKAIMPIYGLVHALGWAWTRRLYLTRGRPEHRDRNERMHRAARSFRVSLGRSLVFEAIKERHVTETLHPQGAQGMAETAS